MIIIISQINNKPRTLIFIQQIDMMPCTVFIFQKLLKYDVLNSNTKLTERNADMVGKWHGILIPHMTGQQSMEILFTES